MNLAAATDRLSSLANTDTPETWALAAELAAQLAEPTALRTLLRSVLTSGSALEATAQLSFRHSNHFDKIVLVGPDAGRSYRLAIHLWEPPYSVAEVSDEQIHDHRCNFWSTVLFGSLASTEYERADEGTLYLERRYRPALSTTGTKRNEYRTRGLARLRSTGTVSKPRGMSYFLPWQQIHRIEIAHEPVATLLVRGPYRTDETSVFSNSRAYFDVDLASLSVDTLRDRLIYITERMSCE